MAVSTVPISHFTVREDHEPDQRQPTIRRQRAEGRGLASSTEAADPPRHRRGPLGCAPGRYWLRGCFRGGQLFRREQGASACLQHARRIGRTHRAELHPRHHSDRRPWDDPSHALHRKLRVLICERPSSWQMAAQAVHNCRHRVNPIGPLPGARLGGGRGTVRVGSPRAGLAAPLGSVGWQGTRLPPGHDHAYGVLAEATPPKPPSRRGRRDSPNAMPGRWAR
jgi:hypothetical protein